MVITGAKEEREVEDAVVRIAGRLKELGCLKPRI